MKILLFSFFISLTPNPNITVSGQDTLFDNNQGNYAVGFENIQTIDYSRNYKNESGRPIQILIWYPAEKDIKSEGISYKNYIDLTVLEDSRDNPSSAEIEKNYKEWLRYFSNNSTPDSTYWDAYFQKELPVFKMAGKSDGEETLLLYTAGSQGEAIENSVMFEYLASYGYTVAAIPSVGSYRHEMNIDPEGLYSQSRDLSFAMHTLLSRNPDQYDYIFASGWSWGGLAALLFQVQNESVDGLISIDGSIATHLDKLSAFPQFSYASIDIPSYYISTRESTYERTHRFYEKLLYSDALLAEVKLLDHSDFISYPYLSRTQSSIEKNKAESYFYVARSIHLFMNSVLVEADPDLSSIPDSLIQFESKRGYEPPPREAEFFEILQSKGINEAREVYSNYRKIDPDYQIFEAYNLTVLAFQYARDEKAKAKAIPIMNLVLDAYPESYGSYALKGRIHEILGENDQALDHFNIAYGMALMDGQRPGDDVERVFYDDINWYSSKIKGLAKQ